MSVFSVEFPSPDIAGWTCDVGNFDEVQRLWVTGIAAFGSVDIWANIAGRDSDEQLFWELMSVDYVTTLSPHLIGLMPCNPVAIAGMQKQGWGRVFRIESFGSDTPTMARHVPPGSTKYAHRYFTKVMIAECKDAPVEVY